MGPSQQDFLQKSQLVRRPYSYGPLGGIKKFFFECNISRNHTSLQISSEHSDPGPLNAVGMCLVE